MSDIECFDLVNGRKIPQLVINEDYVFSGSLHGTVNVEAGHFTLTGKIDGTLNIHPGVKATIAGKQHGTVCVANAATVTVSGETNGSVIVELGGTVIVEAGGKLAGILSNDGLVIVRRGVFGGPQTGRGELKLEGEGWIKEPSKVENGINYYSW